jgi:hypothetical protein
MCAAAPLLMRHQFSVLAHREPSTLARIVAPFVVHDVLPDLSTGADPSGRHYVVSLQFVCAAAVADRLAQRLAAMPAVIEVKGGDAIAPAQRAA